MNAIDIEKDVNVHLENKHVSRSFFWFLWVLYAVVVMTKSCFTGSLASIVSEGLLTKSQTGAITAVFYIVYTPFQIFGGILADKYSPEKMIKIGLVGAALSNVVIFFNQNYYVMLIAWTFNGMIQFGIWPSIFKIFSSQLVRSDRPRMSFFISFATTSGSVLSFALAAILTDWRYNFAVSAALLVFFAITLHIAEKRINPYLKWDAPIEEKTEASKKDKSAALKIFFKSGFFIVLIGTSIMYLVYSTRVNLTSVMLVENYDSVSPSLGNTLSAIMILASVVGNLAVGKFVIKVKNELVLMFTLALLQLPFMITCILVGMLPVSSVIGMLSIVACLQSATELTKTYYTMHFTKYALNGTAAGILNAGNALACVLAAYVMPLIAEKFAWSALLVSLPVLIAISALCFITVARRFSRFKKDL